MMSSKLPDIKVYSPTSKKSRFTWHLPEVRQTKPPQPPRFFGTQPSAQPKEVIKPAIEMVKWENTFNMRARNLDNFPCGTNYRATYRSQALAMQRARLGLVNSATKSLDVLRQNLQKSINKEIDEILQKYLQKFFKVAIENIKNNNGESSVSEQHVQNVCRQILEEAKSMYQSACTTAGNSGSSEAAETESGTSESKSGRNTPKNVVKKKKESDSDSETSVVAYKPRKKKGRSAGHHPGPGRLAPLKVKAEALKRTGPKWDPARLTPSTRFIMGAKANKALGLGATRGRLYIKHPDVFKYSGDQDDKQWLYDHNLMPATGGKAYMLLVEDILELAESEEYKHSPTLMKDEIIGFTVPENMLLKMKSAMQSMRTDTPTRKKGHAAHPHSDSASDRRKREDTSPVSNKYADSRAATPTDDLDIMNTEVPSADPSPYSLGTTLDDGSPSQMEASPTPSDASATLEPPLTASFEVNSSS